MYLDTIKFTSRKGCFFPQEIESYYLSDNYFYLLYKETKILSTKQPTLHQPLSRLESSQIDSFFFSLSLYNNSNLKSSSTINNLEFPPRKSIDRPSPRLIFDEPSTAVNLVTTEIRVNGALVTAFCTCVA